MRKYPIGTLMRIDLIHQQGGNTTGLHCVINRFETCTHAIPNYNQKAARGPFTFMFPYIKQNVLLT